MHTSEINRRQFVRRSVGASVVAAMGGRSSVAFGQDEARRVIDVHCHMFNGKDIPGRQFVRTVVFGEYPEEVDIAARGRLGAALDAVKEGAADLIVAMIQGSAPSVAAERSCLEQDRCGLLWSIFDRASGRSIGGPANTMEEELLADFARLKANQPRLKYFKEDDWKDNTDYVDALLASLESGGRSAGNAPPDVGQEAARKRAATALADPDFEYGPIIQWGRLLSSYRRDILDRYLEGFSVAGFKIALLAPALVDFTNWLPPGGNPEPMADQVALMDLLARKQTTAGVHGYCAFDPLRHMRAKEAGAAVTPLKIAQDAVAQHGFLGVKLYSPMGFQPSGNSELRTFPRFINPRADFGVKLDDALLDLYGWCHAENIPILTHASNSQGANKNYGERAHPKLWREPLAKFPNLRVCLAHLGNFNGSLGSAVDFPNSWEWTIGEMVKTGNAPNLYTDLSYFSYLVGKEDNARLALAKEGLKRWIADFDKDCQKLLYGSDWSMIAQQSRSDSYLRNMAELLRSLGLTSEQLDNIFFQNAVRFLGLSRGQPARARLENYYRSNGLRSDRLRDFD